MIATLRVRRSRVALANPRSRALGSVNVLDVSLASCRSVCLNCDGVCRPRTLAARCVFSFSCESDRSRSTLDFRVTALDPLIASALSSERESVLISLRVAECHAGVSRVDSVSRLIHSLVPRSPESELTRVDVCSRVSLCVCLRERVLHSRSGSLKSVRDPCVACAADVCVNALDF